MTRSAGPLSVAALALVACDRTPVAAPAAEPASDAGAVVPARVVDASPPAAELGSSSPPSADSAVAPAPASASARPPPIGGTWVACYGRFRPTSTPERDVLRLGLLCGPANGMKQLGPVLQGEATEGGVEHAFEAKAGECFRLFAVADAGVSSLAVELRDPKGLPLAADHDADRWPVVNPDGPICVMDDGRYTVRVRARRGAGQYALTVWRLPAAK